MSKESIIARIKALFRGDKIIWIVTLFLILISLLVVYTSSEQLANRRNQNNTYILFRHFVTVMFGIVAMIIAANIKYKIYSKVLVFFFWISIPLLLFTMFLGKYVNNAQRGIEILGMTFQTSDLAKVAIVGYLARVLTVRRDSMDNIKELIKWVMLPILVTVGLIFKNNFSTAAMLFVTCLVVMFLGRIKLKYIFGFVGAVVVAGAIALLVLLAIKPADAKDTNRSRTWLARVERFMGGGQEEEEQEDKFNQVLQAKIAVAGGSVLGKGPGKSTQRNILQHSYSDFIYAIIVEEYGLVGGAFVLILYLVLLFRATRIMIRAPQSYGGLLAMGLAFSLVFQAMLNMGVAVGLLPVTGQPLPFVSMGGTSLMFTGLSLGIIISVSKGINKNNNDERDSEIEVADAEVAEVDS